MRFVWMKKPLNSNCGTINAGISSAATLGSSTMLPTNTPMLVLATAKRKLRARKAKKFILKPIRKNDATSCARDCKGRMKDERD